MGHNLPIIWSSWVKRRVFFKLLQFFTSLNCAILYVFKTLDPLTDPRIFVWTKIPLLLLSLQLTDMWGPHVSYFFNLQSPPAYSLPRAAHLPTNPAAAPPAGLGGDEQRVVERRLEETRGWRRSWRVGPTCQRVERRKTVGVFWSIWKYMGRCLGPRVSKTYKMARFKEVKNYNDKF